MTKTINARVANGLLEPLDDIDLPDGFEVTVTISEGSITPPKKNFIDVLNTTAGAWADTIDCDQLLNDIYENRQRCSRP
ncbi:antitoxin family protein [Candidatus Magnetobacterium casense]|uniref:antitoxin family protein n=1 Tax=Candidatus Magnetobacterium casense TaxID=1455061 RepID=UPI00058F3480|nr:antitoxin family protein [Candidatus Magnetobacterium casensis]